LTVQFLTRPVLDQFQDNSKTGSGINFFPTFLAAFFASFFETFFAPFYTFFAAFFCHIFFAFFADFLPTLGACFFEYAVQKTCYFE